MMSDRHFQGNGIRLRAPEPEDLEVMFRFENATDVWEMSNTTGPYSRFQLKQYIEQTQNDLFADRQLRLMIENGNRQVVGMVDVCSFDPLHNRAEVGIMVDKSCRRQGIGRNALALLEEHCFRYLGIHHKAGSSFSSFTKSSSSSIRLRVGTQNREEISAIMAHNTPVLFRVR